MYTAFEEDVLAKQQIVQFMQRASIEITLHEEHRLAQMIGILPQGSVIYVSHVPSSTVEQVVKTALAVQQAGFLASPHLVAKKMDYPHRLQHSLEVLRRGGVEQVLLVAGDAASARGEFTDTLDILASNLIERSGIKRIGVAGYPDGHKSIGPTLLWKALEAKQAFAVRTGMQMHIVSQFGLNVNAVPDWQTQLVRHGISLPIHVGIAGPTPLTTLIKFAMLCGIGTSLRTVAHNLSAVRGATPLATRPEQHLMRLIQLPEPTQVVAPHFFTFGGVIETAKWIKRVVAGDFEIAREHNHFRVEM
jgi:methylenetetrahydrofolate reductase (NADPH)